MIKPSVVTEITAAGFTKISVPVESASVFNGDKPGSTYFYSMTTEDGRDFIISHNSDGDNPATVPILSAGASGITLPIKVDPDGGILYAKGTSTTNLIVFRGPKA